MRFDKVIAKIDGCNTHSVVQCNEILHVIFRVRVSRSSGIASDSLAIWRYRNFFWL